MAGNQTEKTLNALLSVATRIEKFLSTGAGKKEDKKEGSIQIESLVAGTDNYFKSISVSLKNIEAESKKTNELLEKILSVDAAAATVANKPDAEGQINVNELAQALEGNLDKLAKSIKIIANVPEDVVLRFKKIITTLAFIDSETGKPYITKEQLQEAAEFNKSIVQIAAGVAIFGTQMAIFGLMTPQILKGATGFGMALGGLIASIFLINKVLPADEKKRDSSLVDKLLYIGGGIFLFGLSMAAFGILAPAIFKGVTSFGVVMLALVGFLGIASLLVGKQDKDSPLNALWKVGAGIAAFGLVFILFGTLSGVILNGLKTFTIVAGLTGITIFMLNAALVGRNDGGALAVLWKIGLGISVFAGTMILLGVLKGPILAGMGIFLTVAATVAIALFLLSKAIGNKAKIGPDEEGPLANLWKLSKAIAVFSLTFIAVGLFVKPFAVGALAVTAAMSLIILPLTFLSNPSASRGIDNFQRLNFSLFVFVGAMAAWAFLVQPRLDWNGVAMLGAVIGILGLIGTVLGAPPMDKWVSSGAASLILLGGALTVFSIGLFVYAQGAKNLTWESIAMLGAVIGVMALVGTVLGIPPIIGFVLAGSAGLIALGGALIVFSTGLLIFSKANFKEKDAENLNAALRSTFAGFLGMRNLDEITNPVALARIPMLITLMPVASAAMAAASIALNIISKSLLVFKKTNWSEKDDVNLRRALTGVAIAFEQASKEANWARVGLGILMLKNLGNTLTGIAEGISAFANLSFIEYEYDKNSGKLIPKRTVKLTNADIQNSAVNIAFVLSTLSKPLSEFGKQFSGSGSGGGFLGIDWGGMVGTVLGLKALQTIGTGLSGLAQGVQDWANMTVTEYDIVTGSNGLPQLVPVRKRPITQGEIQMATENIALVLSAMAKPLSDFGKVFASEKEGIFGITYQVENKGLRLGIQAFSQIGTGLGGIAQGIARWANMEYTVWGVAKNPQTGMNELVPIERKTISKSMIDTAIGNITLVLSGLAYPLSEFGKIFTGTETGFFGNEYKVDNKGLLTGIEQMGNIANNLSKMASMVARWANMEYTEMEVYRDEKGMTQLQPKRVASLTPDKLETAKNNIKTVLLSIARSLVEYATEAEKMPKVSLEEIVSNTKNTIRAIKEIATEIAANWTEEITKSSRFFKEWLLNLSLPMMSKLVSLLHRFGPATQNFASNFREFTKSPSMVAMTVFSNNIIKLAKYATEFERFVSAFERMATAMGVFGNNFKIMDEKAIMAFNTWSKTLMAAVDIGKNSAAFDSFLEKAGQTTTAAFKFGEKIFGSDTEPGLDEAKKKSIIEKTTEMTKDEQLSNLVSLIDTLRQEIAGLKAALSGTLNVNLISASPSVKIRTKTE